MTPLFRFVRFFLIALVAFALPATAGATLKREGDWPAAEKKVDLAFDGKPSQGLEKLAAEAGWSIVVSKAIAVDEHDVHIAVDDQPADAVLEALFADSDVVARRSGTLIVVSPAAAAPAAAPPAATAAPAAAPAPAVRGEDKNVVGGSLTVQKGEVVHTVTVTGGSAKISGTVTGDLVVAGGSAKVLEGGRVMGNVSVMGGSVKIEKGGRVDGSVGAVGGAVKTEEGAILGGQVVDEDRSGNVKVSIHDGDVHTSVTPDEHRDDAGGSRLARAAHAFGRKVTAMSLLFVFGCVLLALATGRMEKLRLEAAARPMRSFAVGLVGSIAGGIAAVLAIVVLCITVVGIPVAIFGVLLAVFAVYGAIAAVLTTVGAAVLGHKTQNPYVHLLFGCAAFLVASSLPWLGGLVTFAVVMIAIGTLFSTKLAGFLDRKKPRSMGLV